MKQIKKLRVITNRFTTPGAIEQVLLQRACVFRFQIAAPQERQQSFSSVAIHYSTSLSFAKSVARNNVLRAHAPSLHERARSPSAPPRRLPPLRSKVPRHLSI